MGSARTVQRRTQGAVTRKHARSAASSRRGGDRTGLESTPASKEDQLTAMIESDMLDQSPGIMFDQVAGLAKAKQSLREMVILPATRPDLFSGLRAPTRGLLLYGPPGNGKTLIVKALATESSCAFFAVSASTLTSKWVGEAEKLVRKLFEIARKRAPSIIFIDEIDSVLCSRSSNENESSRRLKTEFLIQFDGINASPSGASDGSVFVVGATNRPDELDDAVRRRLPKRIYVPLPDAEVRRSIFEGLLFANQTKTTPGAVMAAAKQRLSGKGGGGPRCRLSSDEMRWLVASTDGYSASDLKELCHEAAMMGIREISPSKIATLDANDVRPVVAQDFVKAMQAIKPSVSSNQLKQYEDWTKNFGTKT